MSLSEVYEMKKKLLLAAAIVLAALTPPMVRADEEGPKLCGMGWCPAAGVECMLCGMATSMLCTYHAHCQ